MRFYKPREPTDSGKLSFVAKLVVDGRINDTTLVAVDTLKVDSHSRVTISKEVKDILPIKPGDTLAFHQDREDSQIILKIQRESRVVDTLKITREGAKDRKDTGLKQTYPFSLFDEIKADLAAPLHHLVDSSERYRPNIVLIDDEEDALMTFQLYLTQY